MMIDDSIWFHMIPSAQPWVSDLARTRVQCCLAAKSLHTCSNLRRDGQCSSGALAKPCKTRMHWPFVWEEAEKHGKEEKFGTQTQHLSTQKWQGFEMRTGLDCQKYPVEIEIDSLLAPLPWTSCQVTSEVFQPLPQDLPSLWFSAFRPYKKHRLHLKYIKSYHLIYHSQSYDSYKFIYIHINWYIYIFISSHNLIEHCATVKPMAMTLDTCRLASAEAKAFSTSQRQRAKTQVPAHLKYILCIRYSYKHVYIYIHICVYIIYTYLILFIYSFIYLVMWCVSHCHVFSCQTVLECCVTLFHVEIDNFI